VHSSADRKDSLSASRRSPSSPGHAGGFHPSKVVYRATRARSPTGHPVIGTTLSPKASADLAVLPRRPDRRPIIPNFRSAWCAPAGRPARPPRFLRTPPNFTRCSHQTASRRPQRHLPQDRRMTGDRKSFNCPMSEHETAGRAAAAAAREPPGLHSTGCRACGHQ